MDHRQDAGRNLHRGEQPSGEPAEVYRHQAVFATDRQARDRLLEFAADCEAQAFARGSLAEMLLREGRADAFREGYVFTAGLTVTGPRLDRSDWGYWACDIANHNRLSWSDKVYDLFGLPVDADVDRGWAVARYRAHSRSTLERVRDFALRHARGFILDAEIEPEGRCRRWIRVLAVPVIENGQVARLHGLKRAL